MAIVEGSELNCLDGSWLEAFLGPKEDRVIKKQNKKVRHEWFKFLRFKLCIALLANCLCLHVLT